MRQFLFFFISLAVLSSEALAGRYISSISMTVDSREGLYLEPNKTIAPNPMVKAEAKAALAKLYDTNRRIVEFKEEIRTACYARNVKTGEFLRFADLTDEEFVIWERMKGEKAELKKYTSEYIAQRKAFLEAKENLLKNELVNLEEYKIAKFGVGADDRAQHLNIKAAQAEHELFSSKLDKQAAEKISGEFAAAEAHFLNWHLSPALKPKASHGGKVAGIVGAAVIGASVIYDTATDEGAQASEFKAADLNGPSEEESQNRADVSISTLDDK